MSKFHQQGEIVFVNPDSDYFNEYSGSATPEFIDKAHPVDSYDVVHIHFSFDKLTIEKLRGLFDCFDKIKKPVVWTCHGRESQRAKNIGSGELQKLLFSRSKAIITLTDGCKSWLIDTYGGQKKIETIPSGYIIDPDLIQSLKGDLDKKSRDNFVFLIGDFRMNKEINQSIINFIQCSELSGCNLTLLIKPLSIYTDSFRELDKRTTLFWDIIKSAGQRINVISSPEISNRLVAQVFCRSHVCLLPYLWGTHSGQIELAKDAGCYPVVSNVGFYKEQSDQIIEFEYSDKPSVFAYNFTKAMIKARSMPYLKPQTNLRKVEFAKILQKHTDVYKSVLKT
ncbi:MAG: glycosyltransferase [bacterium]|nr:glycosyltransferase [bacterium]